MTKGAIFIYHGGCFDGFTSAWIYSRFVDHDAEFVPVKYGDPVPEILGHDVIIADFSWPRNETKAIIASAATTTLLDHHHTAREALDGINDELKYDGIGKEARIVFDMERSGAGIVWDELACEDGLGLGPTYRGKRPRLVDYVEDRDLWRKALPNTDEYSAIVSATPMTFEAWDELNSMAPDRIVDRGVGILAYIRQYGTKALAEARRYEWPKLWREHWASAPPDEPRAFVWCVNLPYMNCSEHVGRLLEEKGGPFAAGYFRRGDGRWQFSLRSKSDFDVSAVAKLYGGGGHKQAAGFDVADLAEVFA